MSGPLQIALWPPNQVASIWPNVRGHIMRSMAPGASRFYSEWDFKRACLEGRWGLWIIADEDGIHAAAVTYFSDYPQARVCVVAACAGERLKEWATPLREAIEDHARRFGCAFLEASGRKGWARLAGAGEITTVMRKEL